MWFPNEAKVFAAFDELKAEFSRLDKRIEQYEAQVKTFSASLDKDGSFARVIEELRDLYWVAQGDYLEASIALTMGQRSARSAAKTIKPAKTKLHQLSVAIDQMDNSADAGRTAFRNRFGSA